jgi:aromatic ring hydroxylase
VWLTGERIKDVTTHPALRRGAEAIARLYDMQHDPAYQGILTYPSPSSGELVGVSFLQPRTPEKLVLRVAYQKTPDLSFPRKELARGWRKCH